MDVAVIAVFLLVYVGMMLGEIPGLALDRTGIALLGAIALLGFGKVELAEAWDAVDVPTISLLFGFMIVSAQLRLGGFYAHVARRLASSELSPEAFLALLIVTAGGLSALLANDIVCLAMAPVLVEGCARRGYAPEPFLLALACAANVGSAATLVGNPQNILIGQRMSLGFGAYALDASVPVLLGLGVVWLVVRWRYRASWRRERRALDVDAPAFDAWQSAKGSLLLLALVVLFLVTSFPRDLLALSAAGLLLCSRRMASRRVLGYVDWQLLVLFIGLFVVNHAVAGTGAPSAAVDGLAARGLDLRDPAALFAGSALLSNLVSNVPAVMLLLPYAGDSALSGTVLAIASTFAGNLFILGSIANIIVVDQAAALGVRIGFREHARVGIPVTLATLALAASWLGLRTMTG